MDVPGLMTWQREERETALASAEAALEEATRDGSALGPIIINPLARLGGFLGYRLVGGNHGTHTEYFPGKARWNRAPLNM